MYNDLHTRTEQHQQPSQTFRLPALLFAVHNLFTQVVIVRAAGCKMLCNVAQLPMLLPVHNLFAGSRSEAWGLPNVVQTLADFSGEAKSTSSVSQINFKLEF